MDCDCGSIGPLHDPVTWYGINYTGTQVMQWDFQNKGKSGWTGTNYFVLEVPLCNLHPSVIYSVPCDRIVQRAYSIAQSSLSLKFSKWSSFCNNGCSLNATATTFLNPMAVFILEDALSVQMDNVSVPFLYLRRIIHLDKLGQTFLARLVMRLW